MKGNRRSSGDTFGQVFTISKMNIGEKVEVEESDALKMTLRMLFGNELRAIFFFKKN